MDVRGILKLAHREYMGFRARSRATVVVIGVMFGLLLAILMVMQGLENVVMEYARSADGVEVGGCELMEELDEVSSHQENVCRYFRVKEKDFVRPVSIVLVAVAAFILAFTMAHLLTSNAKTFVLYRTVGASKGQILLIYFMYLLRLCAWAAIFAVVLALVLAGIMTGVGWNYLAEVLADFYPTAPQFAPILIGVNWRCAEVILWMFATVPVAFLLCLDQFSDKKMVQRLKGD